MNKEQTALVRAISTEVSPGLANWMRGKFTSGTSVEQVRQDIAAAMRVVEAERTV